MQIRVSFSPPSSPVTRKATPTTTLQPPIGEPAWRHRGNRGTARERDSITSERSRASKILPRDISRRFVVFFFFFFQNSFRQIFSINYFIRSARNTKIMHLGKKLWKPNLILLKFHSYRALVTLRRDALRRLASGVKLHSS